MRDAKNSLWIALVSCGVGVLLGLFLFGGAPLPEEPQKAEQKVVWTCPMHPEIRQDAFGKCPICGMNLTPEATSQSTASVLSLSEQEQQLAGLQTMPLQKREAIKTVALYGRVAVDEQRFFSQSTHLAGRIEGLMVDFVGQRIQKGQAIACVYAPDLVVAQQQLIEAAGRRADQPVWYESVRRKLRQWKLSERQIRKIEKDGVQECFPILSEASGVVWRKEVQNGDYIKEGAALFEVVDLSSVWVLFEVHEQDLAWIEEGVTVDFSTHAQPAAVLQGVLSFVDPMVHPQTRVAMARLIHKNADERLKPNMLVEGAGALRFACAEGRMGGAQGGCPLDRRTSHRV